MRPITALPSSPRIKSFATKPLFEFFCIGRIRETINVKPLPIKDGMAPRTQRHVLAEIVNLIVAAAFTEAAWQRDLVRPAPVNSRWRQLALAAHFQTFA